MRDLRTIRWLRDAERAGEAAMGRSLSCVLCGESLRRIFFIADEARFWRCVRCGLVQMNPIPKMEESGEDYSGFDLTRYREFVAKFRVPQYERDLALVGKYAAKGQLLDIGSGTGEFLGVAGRFGFQAIGIELSPTAFDIARRKYSIVRGGWEDVSFKDGMFDVVTLWSVLEHIPAPSALLRRTWSWLRPGGLLALRVPDVRGLLPNVALWLYRITLGSIDSPLRIIYQLGWHSKHFYGFDSETLCRLLETAGFEVRLLKSENSFDCKSLDLRMNYLPKMAFSGTAARAALAAIFFLATLLDKKDEIVLVAEKI
jgi:2-polyprenyl-3-methyl-5-hydroxy-6-metoxy-1,4-benzoquinol methylase